MKLYFYFLETNKIRTEECEAEEKPKTYKPADKFPSGYYYCSVKKDDIGTFAGYQDNVIVLLENDIEKVAKIFRGKCEYRISRAKTTIRSEEKTIKEQNRLISMIEEWRVKK